MAFVTPLVSPNGSDTDDPGGATWTEERIGTSSFDMTTAPDALGYFVGDYAGLDFADRTDVFATTASRSGP